MPLEQVTFNNNRINCIKRRKCSYKCKFSLFVSPMIVEWVIAVTFPATATAAATLINYYILATPAGIFLKLCQMYCLVMGHHSASKLLKVKVVIWQNLTLVRYLNLKLNISYISATPAVIFLKPCQMYCLVMVYHSTSTFSRSMS